MVLNGVNLCIILFCMVMILLLQLVNEVINYKPIQLRGNYVKLSCELNERLLGRLHSHSKRRGRGSEMGNPVHVASNSRYLERTSTYLVTN